MSEKIFLGRVGPARLITLECGDEIAMIESANGEYASSQLPPAGSDEYLESEARECLAGRRHQLNWSDDVIYWGDHGHPKLVGFFRVPSEIDARTCQMCMHQEAHFEHGSACPVCAGTAATRTCKRYRGESHDDHGSSSAPARWTCDEFQHV